MGLDGLDELVHDLRRLPDGQAADGVTRQVQVCDALHVLDPQIGIRPALVDAPEHLLGVDRVRQRIQPGVFRLAARQPAGRPGAGIPDIVIRRGIFHALVKRHGDIRPQV